MMPRPAPTTNAATVAMLAATVAACEPTLERECHSSTDCPDSTFCRMGECASLEDPAADTPLNLDDDAGPGPDATGVDAGPPHPCPDAADPTPGRVAMTEFMANVPAGEAGDANADGTRHYHDDEFVELVNISDSVVDLAGVTIVDGDDERFTFETTCLQPHHAMVVFGGIETGAEPPEGQGWTSVVSDTWFRFAQDEGRVVVRAPDAETIADVPYGSHPEGSLTLENQPEGTEWVPHAEVSEEDALFSPGTCPDGRTFDNGCEEGDLKP